MTELQSCQFTTDVATIKSGFGTLNLGHYVEELGNTVCGLAAGLSEEPTDMRREVSRDTVDTAIDLLQKIRSYLED